MSMGKFTLDMLFETLQDFCETRADVKSVQIKVENMIRLETGNYGFTVETDSELHSNYEWYELLKEHYPDEKVTTDETSFSELREFFDNDMLEFFEKYRPTLIFNKEEIDIDSFLKDDKSLEFAVNEDT